MGDRVRTKSDPIEFGSLCEVRNFYSKDCDEEPEIGIVLCTKKHTAKVFLYDVLIGESIVERNDLEVKIIQASIGCNLPTKNNKFKKHDSSE